VASDGMTFIKYHENRPLDYKFMTGAVQPRVHMQI